MVQWSLDDKSRLNLTEYFQRLRTSPRDKRAHALRERKVVQLKSKLRDVEARRAYQLTEGQKQHLLESRFVGMLLLKATKELLDLTSSKGVHVIRDVSLINREGRLRSPRSIPRSQMCFRTNAAGGYRLARWVFEDGQSPDFYRSYVEALQKAQAARREQTHCPLAMVIYTSDKSNAQLPVHSVPKPMLRHGKYAEELKRTDRLLKKAVDKVWTDGMECAKDFGIHLRPEIKRELLWRLSRIRQNSAAMKRLHQQYYKSNKKKPLLYSPSLDDWEDGEYVSPGDDSMNAIEITPDLRDRNAVVDSVLTPQDLLAFGQRDGEYSVPRQTHGKSSNRSLPPQYAAADKGFQATPDITSNANTPELNERTDSGFTPRAMSKNRKGLAKGKTSTKNRSRDLLLDDQGLVQALTTAIADNIRQLLKEKQRCPQQDPQRNRPDLGGKGRAGRATAKKSGDQRKKHSAGSKTSASSCGSKGSERAPSAETQRYEILSAAMNKTLQKALAGDANKYTPEMAFTLLEAATAIVRNKDLISPLLSLICDPQADSADAQPNASGPKSGSCQSKLATQHVPIPASVKTFMIKSPFSSKAHSRRAKGAGAESCRVKLDASAASRRVKLDASATPRQQRHQGQQPTTRKAKAKISGSSDASNTSDADTSCSYYSGDESNCPSDCLCQSIPPAALAPGSSRTTSGRSKLSAKPYRSYVRPV